MPKKNCIALFCVVLLSMYGQTLSAQQNYEQERYTLNAGGAYEPALEERTFSATWTIGEIIGETFHASKKRMTQGFLQSEIKISDSVNNGQTVWYEQSNTALKIYPNPCNNDRVYISLSCQENLFGVGVTFFDVQGRELMTEKRNTAHWDPLFNVSSLEEGIYFVKIVSSKGRMLGVSRLVIIG